MWWETIDHYMGYQSEHQKYNKYCSNGDNRFHVNFYHFVSPPFMFTRKPEPAAQAIEFRAMQGKHWRKCL